MKHTYAWMTSLGLLLAACGQDGGGTTGSDTSGGSSASTGELPTTGEAPTTGEMPTTGAADTGTSTTGDPFTADPVCSSGKTWTKGNQESPSMHPGLACLTCHKTLEPEVASRFPIVGTVYPTGHEPDDCLGVDGPAEAVFVEVTTGDGKVIQLPVNASGNFRHDRQTGGSIVFPITARVVQGDNERKMASPQMTGDCNSCHTEAGDQGAPGRIVVP